MKNTKRNRIMLVDDDEMTRIYFRDIFWIHGRSDIYEIVLSSSIKDAVSFIEDKNTRPDVIFLDVLITENGEKNDVESQIKRAYNFVEKIKKDSKFSNIKIIIYSSQKDKKVEEEFTKLGIDGFIIKGDLMPKELIAFTDKVYESNN